MVNGRESVSDRTMRSVGQVESILFGVELGKWERYVEYKGGTMKGDYHFELTDQCEATICQLLNNGLVVNSVTDLVMAGN